MAYFSPFIDETGLHIPTYSEIRDELISMFKQIFGNDIYLDEDSMDYQQISIFARKIFDTNSLAQLVYNNRTPNTAIGIGLDNMAALAGITRKPATYSTVPLVVTGNSGTVITNGQATDGTYKWNLPASVTIPENGTITVEATCDTPGNIGALPNSINTIITPIYGWLSVTNTVVAAAGIDQEDDATLRGRIALATRAPSLTVFASIWAGIQDVEGVNRVWGYENDTGTTSTGTEPPGIPANLPPHSITFIVEGGEDIDVATALWQKKTPGCYTNGTTSIQLTDVQGNIITMRFYRPTQKNVYVKVVLKKLQGYNEEYATKIKEAVSDYIMEMQLGGPVYRSIIWSVATSTMESVNNPAFSVTDVQFSTTSATTGFSTNDVIPEFYEAAYTTEAMVVVEEGA